MSVNITIAVPLDAVAALQSSSDPSQAADAVATITKAVVESAKSLPPDSKPATSDDEDDRLSILSLDSDSDESGENAATRAVAMRKTYHRPERPAGFQVFVKTLEGHNRTIEVVSETTVQQLKRAIQDIEGVPPKLQRLIFSGKQLENLWTIKKCGIGRESNIHLVLLLRGS